MKTRFDYLNCKLDKSFPKKVIGSKKNELEGKIMKKYVVLRAETYSYLNDNGDEDKKSKRHKKFVTKKTLKVKIIKTF